MHALSKSSLSAWGSRLAVLSLGLALAAIGFIAIPANEALAADTISAKSYRDTNTNGTVETIRLTMDENVTACVFESGDWAIVDPGSINVTAVTGLTCTGSNTTLDITVTAGANITGGATSPTITYTDAGTAGSVTLTSGVMTAKTINTITDAAAPIILSGAYLDATGNNGVVDAVSLTTSLDSGLACTAFTGGADFTVGTAGTVVLAHAGGDTCADNNTNTFTITLATGGAADTTGGSTAPIVTYTQPGNGLEDAAGNDVPTRASLTLTDGAAPIVLTVVINKTPTSNFVDITFSEAMTFTDGASSVARGDLTTAGTITGFGSFGTTGDATVTTLGNRLAGNSSPALTLSMADQVGSYFNNTSTTGPSGTFTPVASAAVVDAASNQVNAAHTVATTVTSAWTFTQPTISSVTLSDADFDGRVDTATVVFSAAVRDSNITAADALLGGATHTGTFATGTGNDATTVFTLSADTLGFNTSATAAHFTYSAATTKITSMFGALLNTAVDGAIADADIVEADNAPPVIATISPAHGDIGVNPQASAVITFSEPINFAGCTFTPNPDSTGWGNITTAGNWATANGMANSQVTLANNIAYDRGASVQVTIAGCVAATGGAALHSNAAVTNPLTFTILARGTSSGGGSVVVTPATLAVSIPTSGATLTGGSTVGISWSSANGAFIKYKVSYSSNNGNTWTVLTENAATTSYSWTVPQQSTTQGYIKVEGLDAAGVVLASDQNDTVFKVNGTIAAEAPVNAPTTAPAPAVDPTVKGSYAASEAKANNPSINDDKALVAPSGTALCVSGTLIKSSAAPAVYYCGADGKRYVFVNDKAYFSWYADFSGVQTISAETLAAITIGGNITYRPGTRMVKIQTDPKVYAVARGGVLRWVQTETAAARLFGADWNKQIDDVADSFFVNYKVGDSIAY